MSRRAPSIAQVAPSVQGTSHCPQSEELDEAAGVVSRETLDRLRGYAALVEKWTGAINLVSHSDRNVIWSRHVLDSLRLVPLIPSGTGRGIDLGSGAGFPGLVIALATGIPFELVEADQRKAAFLVEARRVTGAPVTVRCGQIEALDLPQVPLVTARALSPLSALLDYASRLLLPGGTALFPKGARVDEEISRAREDWCMRLRRCDDPKHPGSTILMISELTRA